jgi:general secretion pathway protein C
MEAGLREVTLHDNRRMVSRIAAFVIWAAVAASVVFWALRLGSQPIAAPAHALVVTPAAGQQGDLAKLLGVDAPAALQVGPAVQAAPADARFRLIGVVAPRAATARAEGVALIATDGKPAKAYRVGTPVEGELMLLSVHARGASLGAVGQPVQMELQLPALPPPSTGTMPGSAGMAPARSLPAPAARPMAPPQPVMPPPAPPVVSEPPDIEPEPDPADRPMRMPPTGAGRPAG